MHKGIQCFFATSVGPSHTNDLVDIVEHVEVDKDTRGLRSAGSLLQDQSTRKI